MTVYYNEFDPKKAAWLRELIRRDLIAPGDVDERSIVEVQPDDLDGYAQCHFFAGIGGWSYALRLAGWPDDRPVWTASLPCQPFSSAGLQRGTDDERHLWPSFLPLVAEFGPPTLFGEQVASRAGREWFAGVRAGLEGVGYACGAADLCAACVGAPHIRQRLFWVADAGSSAGERRARGLHPAQEGVDEEGCAVDGTGDLRLADGSQDGCRVADAMPTGRPERGTGPGGRQIAGMCGDGCGLGDADDAGPQGHARDGDGGDEPGRVGADEAGSAAAAGVHNLWSDSTIVICHEPRGDGYREVARRIEPGLAPVAHGLPARVVRLRGYGDAIVPQVAAQFIEACMSVTA